MNPSVSDSRCIDTLLGLSDNNVHALKYVSISNGESSDFHPDVEFFCINFLANTLFRWNKIAVRNISGSAAKGHGTGVLSPWYSNTGGCVIACSLLSQDLF